MITELETIEDIFNVIKEKYPNWIIDVLDSYSTDYPELQANWNILCDIFKAKPQKILLVSAFEADDHFSFAEVLTQVGFVVRTIHEFHACDMCKSAIPNKHIYEKMKELKKNVPSNYQINCSICS